MRELLSKYSKVHPDHFLLDVFEEGDGSKWKRKLDMAVETFYSTREDEGSGKKKSLLSSRECLVHMVIYYLNKERNKTYTKKS